ncbi:MAG: hypothetical protein RL038_280, partial [Actinomycetota bacterium]
GFQLLNPSYPELQELDVLHELDLRSFVAGIDLVTDSAVVRLADPRRAPLAIGDAILKNYASPIEKLQMAAAVARILKRALGKKIESNLMSVETDLLGLGVPQKLYDQLVKPFLTGVFLADPSRVSASYGDFVLRSFFNGTPAVPAQGMGQLPKVLANRLHPGSLQLNHRVENLHGQQVQTNQGTYSAEKIILAVAPKQLQQWLSNLPQITTVGCTTWYFAAPKRVKTSGALRIDATQSGPVLNSVVLSETAPGYASGGRSLISTTTLGGATFEIESAVRTQLTAMWGEQAQTWEFVEKFEISEALPLIQPGAGLSLPVKLDAHTFVAGDHRDTPSQQGALLSGRRAARAAMARK